MGAQKSLRKLFKFSILPIAAAAVLGITSFTTTGALAQESKGVDLPLAASTMAKIVDANDLGKSMQANPDGRHRVLVQYRLPEFASALRSGGEIDDAAHIARNHAQQDAVLSAVFGSADAMLSGALADVYGVQRMDYSPVLVLQATAEEIDRLAANPDVVSIQPDVPVPPVMDQSTAHVDMPPVWTAGGTGAGRTIAVLDTGVKKTHEFITSAKVVSEACYNTISSQYGATSFCPGGVQSSTASGSGADCSESTAAGCSHGTHVAGTTSGNNTSRQTGEPRYGMAYDAKIIAINIFTKFTDSAATTPLCGGGSCVLSFTSDQIEGLERVYALRNTYNIDAVNMSLGGGQYFSACDTDTRKSIIDLLRGAGIATVIAAGNDYFTNAVGAPGCISSAITVAASLDTSDSKASYSNWATMVDVVAPGSNIQSSIYGFSSGATSSYSNYNGTSMATPHVVGAFAALRDLYPTATVTAIENALESTGVGITSSGVTKPRIDMDAACASLGGGTCGTSNAAIVAAVLPNARATQVGNPVTAFASIINYGTATATNCSIALPGPIANTTFVYQQTNASNVPVGSPNAPVSIAAGATQGFYFGLTKTSGTFNSNIGLVFDCTNTSPAPITFGVNSFQYTVSSSPIADMISVAATVNGDGYINIPGTTGQNIASVAAVNNGSTGSVTVSVTEQANGGVDPNMPATLLVCRTNASGTCLAPFATSQTFTASAGTTYYFTVLAIGSGTVADNPGTNRAHVYFTSGGQTVGSTSVAVRTQ